MATAILPFVVSPARPLRVLAGCEISGKVRDAFLRLGHDAYSCDTSHSDHPRHITGDLLSILNDGWDLLIAFPPCTFLCASGLHWNRRREGRAEKTELALAFVRALMAAPVPKIAIENPRGRIGTAVRPANQTIQPYEFGDDASKATCLWLKGLPLLRATNRVPGRWVTTTTGRMVERWGNQTDSGQNRLGPSAQRAALRAETYPGIADAMAEQWGGQIVMAA